MRLIPSLLLVLALVGCTKPTPLLERIKEEGTLTVLTRNSATTYYEGPEGLIGLEHDLVRLFAEELGVQPRFVVPDSFDAILPMISRGEAHLAAAGLTVTPSREKLVRFGPPYQKITQQLIYRAGSRMPKTIEDTIDGLLEVIAGSSHEEELLRLKAQYPNLDWEAQQELESEELLYLVKEQIIDYTIADSNEVALNRRYYPELKIAFDLTESQPLAWAFPHSHDSSLYDAAAAFFERIEQNGILAQLIERYYGYSETLTFVDKRSLRRHIHQRLPGYIHLFKQAAEATGLDWRLLAAISYQESHWNPDAVSPTGVRGIMMLTQATATHLDIEDRLDPEASIMGGARYLRMMEEKIPERVPEPDRLWLALAGYNLGFGHLEDARVLTQQDGGDPDKWSDVKDRLPLLGQKKWHNKTKHGYARGREPVDYVDNIRSYYDLLIWFEPEPWEKTEVEPFPVNTLPPAL